MPDVKVWKFGERRLGIGHGDCGRPLLVEKREHFMVHPSRNFELGLRHLLCDRSLKI
jgi:hypothetical protein